MNFRPRADTLKWLVAVFIAASVLAVLHVRSGHRRRGSSVRAAAACNATAGPWEFVEYVPSQYEGLWERNAGDREWAVTPCKHSADPGVPALLEAWVKFSAEYESLTQQTGGLTHPGGPFSTFVYKDACGVRQVVPIEPFALVHRHPYLCRACDPATGLLLPNFRQMREYEDHIVNKDYMLIEWRIPPHSRAWYFDLGAS
jgi:hypothetical protein